MENQEQVKLLRQGSSVWNTWRERHPEVKINLHRVNLSRADLSAADLSRANLHRANLHRANLHRANLGGANLAYVNLSEANLSEANLRRAYLSYANLSAADLSGAILRHTTFVRTNFTGATLTQCSVYGISAWNVQLDGAKQENLDISDYGEPTIAVDNLEVAQFIYLLLNNPKIRDVIDTVAKKAVLILGRFTPERKAILEAIRIALRERGYLPILFDFEKPSSQDLTETVSTLAHLAGFIIVDLTDPSSTPYEIATIANNHIKPIQPIIQPSDEAKHEFAMFKNLRTRHHWVLPIYQYQDQENLLDSLQDKIIAPSEHKVKELEALKATLNE